MLKKEICIRVFDVLNNEITAVIYDNMPMDEEIEK